MQAKFTLAISFTVLLFFTVLLLISFTYFKNYSIEKSKEYAAAILNETNSKINLFFTEVENLAQSLSHYDAVREIDPKAMKNIFLSTVYARKAYIRAIYLGTARGVMYEWGYGEGFYHNVPQFPRGYDPRKRPWYKTAVKKDGFSISAPYIYASVQALGITGVIPVYSPSGRFTGVLGIDIILQGLHTIMRDLNTQHTSKIILLNRNREILASQFESASGNVIQLQKYSAADKITGRRGYFIDTIKDEKRFVSYMQNEATGWILLTALPYQTIMEFSNSTIEVTFLTDIFLIFILVIIINILMRKIVTGHLENIAAVMKKISSGELHARVPVSGSDEFSEIAKLFNHLAEIREKYTYTMEDEVKKRTEEVTNLQRENTRLRVLEEKERIFQNLHDSLGARLTNIFISNNVARSASQTDPVLLDNMLSRIEINTEAGIQDLKEIIFDHGKERAIIDFTHFFIVHIRNRLELRNIALKYKIKNKEAINGIPRSIRFEIEKILQELVTNVLKHSQATAVTIDIRATDSLFAASFKDNGVGFNKETGMETGFGLKIIQERAQKLGGTVKLKTQRGSGTRYVISIPLAEES